MKTRPTDLGARLRRASTKAQSGKDDAAIALYRKILGIEPGHRDAHASLCQIFLKRGSFASAVRHAEFAAHSQPRDLGLWQLLAKAHDGLLGKQDAEEKLAAICTDLPFAFASLLHVAHLREARNDKQGALITYTRAIKTAQLRGFWLDDSSTQPWLITAVRHAMKFAHDERIEFFHDWLEPMHERHGRDTMRRVADCLEMHLGIKPVEYADPRQKPSFLYFPGLPVAPIFERKVLPFAEWYESQANVIREEMLRVLDTAADIQPFHFTVPEERRGELTKGGNWDAYFFFNNGERFESHHDACPETSRALAQLPLDHVRDHGPEVCFSIMRPGAHILPHRGITNTRSVLHLGLEIPNGCALNLTKAGQIKWQRGKCLAFDDTYEHEAWNHSDATRVILLGDIWNPYLTEPERDAVADLVATIGDFNRATKGVPLN
ncbi:MAG TPA: aspartyl/asparaginyl beta-hydroxylase domain-containing protein [Gammaproteobacteria bacterium]